MGANSPSAPVSIQILSGPESGRSFQMTKAVITIGRDPNNDIAINDPTMSRQHARLQRDYQGLWSIEKLAATNTLLINQVEVQRSPLQDRDTISLGPHTSLAVLLPLQDQVQTTPRVQLVRQQESGQPAILNSPSLPPFLPPSPPHPQTVSVALPMQSVQPLPFTPRGTQIAAPLEELGVGVPSLEISTSNHTEKRICQLTKTVVNIGRDPSNEITINDPTVSSLHAQIVLDDGHIVLLHPHPSRQQTVNGLLYQGQKIAGNQRFRQALRHGDIMRIGDTDGALVTMVFNDGSGRSLDVIPEMHPIPLGAATITLGRLPDNMVVLNHPQVSAYHARLERTGSGYRIIDMGSTNHVYVNGQRIRDYKLSVGDEIRIGPFKLTYTGTQLTQQDESSSIRIDALNLNKTGSKNVVLLNDISLSIPPRKFVALVGGSGAGKSTLMDALNGLRPAQQGSVLYNGQDYYQNLAAFSTQLGYVPQDDIIHRELSVERALYYAAKLRLPDDFTEAQIKQRVEEVLEDVEMKYRRNLLVSKLSGGQRKRVSIALELLARPNVFFLDEPTSGLDPGLDLKMMLLLRKLADKGHTIILVTHATTNINVCDYVCFLAQGGRLAYYGPPDEAKRFFGKASFAEIYSALEPTEENPDIPAQVEASFKSSPDYQRYVLAPLHQGPANQRSEPREPIKPPLRGQPLKQFLLLSLRYVELLKNDVGTLAILLLQAPIIGLILMFLASSATFEATRVANCPTHANILATSGPIVSRDCQRVVDALKTPQGAAFAQQQKKSPSQIVQDSILFGSGATAQEILFVMAFAAVMFGCVNAAREIVKEGPIYRRERAVNLGIMPYMLSKCVVLGVLCLLQSGVLVLMVNLTIPFHQGIFLPVLLEVYITLALTSLAGLMLGLTISTIAPNTDRAMGFIPIILIPQVIFSGIIFSLEGLPTQILGGLFAARWSIAGLGSSIGLHGDKLGVDSFAYCGTLFSTCSQQDAITHLLIVWAALVIMILVLGGFVGFFLKRKDVRK